MLYHYCMCWYVPACIKLLLSLQQFTQDKFNVCREIQSFTLPSCVNDCREATTCLTRSHLVSYYNELVIQLRIAQHLINTSITREIPKDNRTEVEEKEINIIKLLNESILPLLHITVSI